MAVNAIREQHVPILTEPLRVSDIVQKIAIDCLKELAFSFAMGATVILFVPFAAGISVMASALFVQLAVSVFFRALGAYSSYKIAEGSPNTYYFEKAVSLCEWLVGINFAVLTGYNVQTLIHESGHAMAASFIYKKAQPVIEIYPFLGGITQFQKTPMTPFGKNLGPVAATCLRVASGPALTLILSSVLFAIGLAIQEKHPQLGKYLISWSLLDFIVHSVYAYSAVDLDPSNLTHDFTHLAIFGLDPITATIGIIAIPTLIALGNYYWK